MALGIRFATVADEPDDVGVTGSLQKSGFKYCLIVLKEGLDLQALSYGAMHASAFCRCPQRAVVFIDGQPEDCRCSMRSKLKSKIQRVAANNSHCTPLVSKHPYWFGWSEAFKDLYKSEYELDKHTFL